jgi:hypothetical protein
VKRAGLVLTGLVLAWLWRSGPARGQSGPAPATQVRVSGCSDVDARQVERILAIELRESKPRSGATSVRVSCSGTAASVELDDGTTGKQVVATIDLEATAAIARARVLALAVAELLQWSWSEPPPDAPRKPVEQVQPTRRDQETTRTLEERPWVMQGFLGGYLQPMADILLLGAGARGTLRRGAWAGAVEVQYDLGSRPLEGATAQIRLLSGAASGWYRPLRSTLTGGFGIGLRFGRVVIEGVDVRSDLIPGSTSGVWGGPTAMAAIGFEALALSIEARFEAGWALASAEGQVADLDRVRLSGPWLGLQLGIGVAP